MQYICSMYALHELSERAPSSILGHPVGKSLSFYRRSNRGETPNTPVIKKKKKMYAVHENILCELPGKDGSTITFVFSSTAALLMSLPIRLHGIFL